MNPCIHCAKAIIAVSGILMAQDAVPIVRKPPTATKADYSKAAAVLSARKPAKTKPAVPMISGTIDLPGDRPIILPESAIQAIQLEANWRNNQAAPMIGTDGRIMFVFGHGQPNIPVAPDKICTIEFQPGEVIDDSGIEIGDSASWSIARHQVIRAGQLQSSLTLKPKRSGLDTPMMVFTNQRAYPFRLLSDQTGFIERVAFTYPDDDLKARQEHAQAIAAEVETRKAAEQEKVKRDFELAKQNTDGPIINTDYTVKASRKADYLRPKKLGDDGYHVKIQLSEKARHRDFPALRIMNNGTPDTPNVHVDQANLTYTVDGLFEEAELVSGVGKHKLSVRIINNSQKGSD